MSSVGKSQLEAIAAKRLTTYTTKDGLEFTLRKLSGKQREAHTRLTVELGAKLKAAGIDISKDLDLADLAAKNVAQDLQDFFSEVMYLLVSMSVMNGDALPKQEQLWTAEEAANDLNASLVTELSAECERINLLSKKATEQAETDFTKTQS